MSRRQSDNESAKRSKPYTGRDGPVLEQHKPPPVGKEADTANGPAIEVNLDLDPAAIRAGDG